jgi:hypothetical protein
MRLYHEKDISGDKITNQTSPHKQNNKYGRKNKLR